MGLFDSDFALRLIPFATTLRFLFYLVEQSVIAMLQVFPKGLFLLNFFLNSGPTK